MPQTHFRGGLEPKPGLDFRGRTGRDKKTDSARALGALPSLAPLVLTVESKVAEASNAMRPDPFCGLNTRTVTSDTLQCKYSTYNRSVVLTLTGI